MWSNSLQRLTDVIHQQLFSACNTVLHSLGSFSSQPDNAAPQATPKIYKPTHPECHETVSLSTFPAQPSTCLQHPRAPCYPLGTPGKSQNRTTGRVLARPCTSVPCAYVSMCVGATGRCLAIGAVVCASMPCTVLTCHSLSHSATLNFPYNAATRTLKSTELIHYQ